MQQQLLYLQLKASGFDVFCIKAKKKKLLNVQWPLRSTCTHILKRDPLACIWFKLPFIDMIQKCTKNCIFVAFHRTIQSSFITLYQYTEQHNYLPRWTTDFCMWLNLIRLFIKEILCCIVWYSRRTLTYPYRTLIGCHTTPLRNESTPSLDLLCFNWN